MADNQNREMYQDENLDQGKSSDGKNINRTGNKKGRKGSSDMATRENTRSRQGPGSSQRNRDTNVGPLDADLNELPSRKRIDEDNQTGPGLG